MIFNNEHCLKILFLFVCFVFYWWKRRNISAQCTLRFSWTAKLTGSPNYININNEKSVVNHLLSLYICITNIL